MVATIVDSTVYCGNAGEMVILLDGQYGTATGVVGGSGPDILVGNSLNNALAGNAGADQLWGGGGGTDTLAGGAGADLYWWGQGDGRTVVRADANNAGDGVFLYDSAASQWSPANQGGNLVFPAAGNQALVLENWYASGADSRVQSFVFSDRAAMAWNNGQGAWVNLGEDVYQTNQVRKVVARDNGNCTLLGGGGNDYLSGASGDDQLWGGAGGNDTLLGGGGTNTYWYGAHDGNDTIAASAVAADSLDDTVRLYNLTDAVIRQQGSDLVLDAGGGNTLTMLNWYAGSQKVNRFVFADDSVRRVTANGWEMIGYQRPGFNIEVDYTTFDQTGFFTDHPDRIAVVEEACRVWEGIIADDFDNIRVGAVIQASNPNGGDARSITLTQEIDDLRLYMGSSFMDEGTLGVARYQSRVNTGNARLDARYNDYYSFQPWTGSLAINASQLSNFYFDYTPWDPGDDSVPGDKYDFLDVVVHEIGHLLGFGSQNVGSDYAETIDGVTYFNGPNVRQLYGGPVPLDFNSGTHIAATSQMLSTMEPSLATGTRVMPTALDKAFLMDFGYTVR